MGHADYRKYNDRSQNSSKYHKKDSTNTRAILKKEACAEIDQARIDALCADRWDEENASWEYGEDVYS